MLRNETKIVKGCFAAEATVVQAWPHTLRLSPSPPLPWGHCGPGTRGRMAAHLTAQPFLPSLCCWGPEGRFARPLMMLQWPSEAREVTKWDRHTPLTSLELYEDSPESLLGVTHSLEPTLLVIRVPTLGSGATKRSQTRVHTVAVVTLEIPCTVGKSKQKQRNTNQTLTV